MEYPQNWSYPQPGGDLSFLGAWVQSSDKKIETLPYLERIDCLIPLSDEEARALPFHGLKASHEISDQNSVAQMQEPSESEFNSTPDTKDSNVSDADTPTSTRKRSGSASATTGNSSKKTRFRPPNPLQVPCLFKPYGCKSGKLYTKLDDLIDHLCSHWVGDIWICLHRLRGGELCCNISSKKETMRSHLLTHEKNGPALLMLRNFPLLSTCPYNSDDGKKCGHVFPSAPDSTMDSSEFISDRPNFRNSGNGFLFRKWMEHLCGHPEFAGGDPIPKDHPFFAWTRHVRIIGDDGQLKVDAKPGRGSKDPHYCIALSALSYKLNGCNENGLPKPLQHSFSKLRDTFKKIDKSTFLIVLKECVDDENVYNRFVERLGIESNKGDLSDMTDYIDLFENELERSTQQTVDSGYASGDANGIP